MIVKGSHCILFSCQVYEERAQDKTDKMRAKRNFLDHTHGPLVDDTLGLVGSSNF
jgi:hypothetical protein